MHTALCAVSLGSAQPGLWLQQQLPAMPDYWPQTGPLSLQQIFFLLWPGRPPLDESLFSTLVLYSLGLSRLYLLSLWTMEDNVLTPAQWCSGSTFNILLETLNSPSFSNEHFRSPSIYFFFHIFSFMSFPCVWDVLFHQTINPFFALTFVFSRQIAVLLLQDRKHSLTHPFGRWLWNIFLSPPEFSSEENWLWFDTDLFPQGNMFEFQSFFFFFSFSDVSRGNMSQNTDKFF